MSRRLEIVVTLAIAAALAALVLALRPGGDPLHRLTTHPEETAPAGAEVRTGLVDLPRGGPYRFGLQRPEGGGGGGGGGGGDGGGGDGDAIFELDGQRMSNDPMQPTRVVRERAAIARIRVVAPAGARLMWHPPGRVTQQALEYLPASSLTGDAGRFGAEAGTSPEDAAAAAALIVIGLGAGLVLMRRRLLADRRLLLGAVAVLVLAAAVRLYDRDAAGQTWDEDVNWSAGRNYVENVLNLDASPRSWLWNYEHPPVSKYLHGVGALWEDGYGAARAVMGLVIALGCALLVPIGARLWSRTAGMIAGVAAALSPTLIAHGKVVGHEAPTVLWWTLAMLLCLGAHDMGDRDDDDGHAARLARRLPAIGVVLGLAIASRFVNALLAVPIGVTLVALAPAGTRQRTIGLGLAIVPTVAVVTIVALWPRLWTSPLAHLAESWARLRTPHSPEPYLGVITNAPPPSYFLVYLVATAPFGLLLAAVAGAVRCGRVALRRDPPQARERRAALVMLIWMLAPLGVMASPVRQDGIRYVMPCLTGLALLAGAGVDDLGGLLASVLRGFRTLVGAVLGAALAGYLVLVCARIHPYYLDYFGEQVGGPAGVAAARRFEVGWWGEGLADAVAYVNREAAPGARVHRDCIEPAHVAWFRGDLWPAMVRDPGQADWIVAYEPASHPCPVPADARLVHSVTAMGAPLVLVYRRAPLAGAAAAGHPPVP